ncbi:MAG TPA: DNA recombination/repair protein RecA, partial [Spirochaetota bacterium]|nr:DNA recombination/repair protein RecA [Spirochaetota bacterium]
AKSNTCVIFINQIRMKIGVMFGSPETTTGGNALKFYSSVRLDIRRVETLKNGEDSIGNRVRVKVVKNKVAPPFRQAEFDIMYDTGISKEGGILDLAVKYDIINKSGTWYSYRDERIGQGRENAKKYLRDNEVLCKEIEERIKKEAGIISSTQEEKPKDASKAEGKQEQKQSKSPARAVVSEQESLLTEAGTLDE